MSEVAGRLAPQIGAHFLERGNGGRGVLLGGAPGVRPARVVVIGAGTVGTNAAWIAQGMEAEVILIDRDLDRLRVVDQIHRGRIMTLASSQAVVERSMRDADLVIGAVLVPGGRAPVVATEEMVRGMMPGSVIVDVAVDQGGCIETTVETTHDHPVVVRHGVLHYGVGNIPAAVPHTSTYALTNATFPYALTVADNGVRGALEVGPRPRRRACCARRDSFTNDGRGARPWGDAPWLRSTPCRAAAPLTGTGSARRVEHPGGGSERPCTPTTRHPGPAHRVGQCRVRRDHGDLGSVAEATRQQRHDGVVGRVGTARGEARRDARGGGRVDLPGPGRPSKTTVTSTSGPTKRGELEHESAPGAGAVTPPPVGARADEVHAVDHPVQRKTSVTRRRTASRNDNTGVNEHGRRGETEADGCSRSTTGRSPTSTATSLARCGAVAVAEDLTAETLLAAVDAVRRDDTRPGVDAVAGRGGPPQARRPLASPSARGAWAARGRERRGTTARGLARRHAGTSLSTHCGPRHVGRGCRRCTEPC